MTVQYIDIQPDSPSIQTHLGIMQGIIQRMASNSSNCKAWCVTLVAAVLVIVADKGKPEFAWIALLPTVIFCLFRCLLFGFRKSF